jgi:ectoine hydroxylase-related dioxygenase (phytanoyl-CoA dioxygenase family)
MAEQEAKQVVSYEDLKTSRELGQAMAPVDPDKAARETTLAEIESLGLTVNLAQLDSVGFTTIKGAISPDLAAQARSSIIRVMERKTGHAVDIDKETGDIFNGVSLAHYLLFADAVFEDIVLAEKPLALMSYLLGRSCKLSRMTCHFKGPGGSCLPLHSDTGKGLPPPFSMLSQAANVNYALTPYSRQDGALGMVPGSHRLCRQPRPDEALLGDNGNPDAVSMDIEPGDAVVWHGNTWHGSFVRTIPGIRMNLAVYFARHYVVTQEKFGEHVPDEFLARYANNPRMLQLLGQQQAYGWDADGPDWAKFATSPRGQFD